MFKRLFHITGARKTGWVCFCCTFLVLLSLQLSFGVQPALGQGTLHEVEAEFEEAYREYLIMQIKMAAGEDIDEMKFVFVPKWVEDELASNDNLYIAVNSPVIF